MDGLRSKLERRVKALDQERRSWWSHWQELSDYLLPRRGNFLLSDTNRGAKKNTKIINNAGTLALRTLSSGMMAGMTSPSRPWFKLGTPDPELAEHGGVALWLETVTKRMYTVFRRSNLYNALPTVYEELGLFGTHAMAVLPDRERVLRFYPYTAGEYHLAVDHRLAVDTFAREYERTVEQVVDQFGKENVSQTVRDMYDRGNLDSKVKCVHVIEPRRVRELDKADARNMPWASVYYEEGASKERLLRVSGFQDFPVLAPRWHVAGADAYGRSPGMEALGDVRQLQLEEKRKAQMIDKISAPPLQSPGEAGGNPVSMLPGGVTFLGNRLSNAQISPIHEIPPVAIQIIQQDILGVVDRINSAFFADLFLMLSMSDRRQITATEVAERHEEKLLMLGPVVERVQNELLDPLIDRAFSLMLEAGMIPEPPQALQGTELRVEYVSVLAQAQALVGIGAIERIFSFAGGLAQVYPEALDKLDADQALDEMSGMLGVPQRVIVSDDDVEAKRAARAQQQQAAQVAASAPGIADTVKTISETDVGTDSLLSRMTGGLA